MIKFPIYFGVSTTPPFRPSVPHNQGYTEMLSRVRLTTNVHDPRLGRHTSSAHCPGKRTTQDCTYTPTKPAAHRVRFTSNAPSPRLYKHTSSAYTPKRRTTRTAHIRPCSWKHSRFNSRRTYTTLIWADTFRAHTAPPGA